jgi:hypothetical protein
MEAAARNEGAEFDWQASRFDFEALAAAIMRLLERMGPPGAVERSRYAQYPTPADLGRTAAETVLAIATLDKARAHEIADTAARRSGRRFMGCRRWRRIWGWGEGPGQGPGRGPRPIVNRTRACGTWRR